jgi:hypothetical protein
MFLKVELSLLLYYYCSAARLEHKLLSTQETRAIVHKWHNYFSEVSTRQGYIYVNFRSNIFFLLGNFNVADPLINHSSIYVQQISATQDVTGLIVVTPTVNPIELPIRILQQNGAVAVVMVHDGIGT